MAHLIWNKLQPQTLYESKDIYISNTFFEVLHYDFLFSIQGGGQGWYTWCIASSRRLQVKFMEIGFEVMGHGKHDTSDQGGI